MEKSFVDIPEEIFKIMKFLKIFLKEFLKEFQKQCDQEFCTTITTGIFLRIPVEITPEWTRRGTLEWISRGISEEIPKYSWRNPTRNFRGYLEQPFTKPLVGFLE